MPAFTHPDAFAAFLDRLGLFHMDLGLNRIRACLDTLGLTRLPYVSMQVLGTNGKGTTAAYTAALAQAQGVRAGLYASPHFLTPRERIKVDGRMLDDEAWLAAANAVHAAQAEPLTYFEVLTAMAALAFAQAGVDLAVFEAGLGGRSDATTALDAQLAVFTPVGLDHQHVIGPTLAHIAADKAAAMRPGAPALTAPQDAVAFEALRAEARAKGVDLKTMAACLPAWADAVLPPTIGGTYLEQNARLALAAWTLAAPLLGLQPEQDAAAGALARCTVPGRLQRVPGEAGAFPDLILDGAHNPAGLRALGKSLQAMGVSPAAVVFTCLADKDLDAMAGEVRQLAAGPVLVPGLPGVERARPAVQVAEAVGKIARTAPDLARALAAVEPACRDTGRPALVCGSLYLLADFFTLRPLSLDSGPA